MSLLELKQNILLTGPKKMHDFKLDRSFLSG